uniref:Large ribosomal subunit protein uL11m n=1 Tax=Rhizochromulina marina TaxID=1034831 RepID=A0A7S2STT6_9STRA
MAGVARIVKLRVPAGSAKPGPAIGQALGPLGINMMEFCKAFNQATEQLAPNTPIPVRLTAMTNRTFTFVTKSPPTSWFLKRCAGIDKGAQRPGHSVVGSVSVQQVYEIAKAKQQDDHLQHLHLKSLCQSIIASATSMGIQVTNDRATSSS